MAGGSFLPVLPSPAAVPPALDDLGARGAILGQGVATLALSGVGVALGFLAGVVCGRRSRPVGRVLTLGPASPPTFVRTVSGQSDVGKDMIPPTSANEEKFLDLAKARGGGTRRRPLKGPQQEDAKSRAASEERLEEPASPSSPSPEKTKNGFPAPQRTVVEAEALQWLADTYPGGVLPDYACVITGIPDAVEVVVPGRNGPMPMEEYREWLQAVALRIFELMPEGGRVIFMQTDTKVELAPGRYVEWLDKGFLLQCAARRAPNVRLLWHKVASYDPVNSTARSRGGGLSKARYSHLLCFCRGDFSERHDGPAASVPDVLLRGGTTWVRGAGARCCLALCRYAKRSGFTQIIDPFCGEGLLLAVANHCGLDSIGVEMSRKRAETARRLDAAALLAQDLRGQDEVGGCSSPAPGTAEEPSPRQPLVSKAQSVK